MRYQVKWHPNKWSKINERLHAFANCKSPASIAGGLERNSVRCAQQKISSRFVPPSTMRSTMTSAQPFTVSLHDGQLPRADAVAHAGRLVPRQGQHRHGSPQCEQPRTPCLSLRARAPGHHRFANGSGTDHPCCGADALPRSPALKTRRCAARVGERFLAVRLPGPQIQDKAADVSEPRHSFAQGQAQAPTRRSIWLGTLPGWEPDSPVCAGCIRYRIRFSSAGAARTCADRSRSFRRLKSDETGKTSSLRSSRG